MKSCELNEVIGSVLDILNRTIRENIQIIQRLAPEDIFVTADRGQLVQIILNLIVNAQDAIVANGTVTIETSEVSMDDEIVRMNPGMIPGRYALLAVSDSGSGMDDETLTHIFEPFYTTKQAGHGTGLGLATVYGIIKQHDGFVNVISRPGLGTVFRIYLPINAIQKQTTDIKCDSSWSERKGSGTILVVDDNLMVLELITDVLKDAGYSVHAASSPRNALEVAGQLPKQISLLLTDLIMPGMSGNELFEQLSQLQPDLKVMYVSGYASKVHVRGGCLEDGVNFLPKPFTRQELLERVQKLI
jgi:CheY-like chemotaxis protein